MGAYFAHFFLDNSLKANTSVTNVTATPLPVAPATYDRLKVTVPVATVAVGTVARCHWLQPRQWQPTAAASATVGAAALETAVAAVAAAAAAAAAA